MFGNGGGLLCAGSHKLFQDTIFVGECVVHVVHIIVYFFEEVGGDAGEQPGWIGS